MFFWFLSLTLFSKFALSQSLSTGDFDFYARQAAYAGKVSRDKLSWSALKEDLRADVVPGTEVYSLPKNVFVNNDRDPGYNQCGVRDGTKVKVLAIYDNLAIVRLLGDKACPPTFNVNYSHDPNLAFMPVSALKNLARGGDSMISRIAKPICAIAHGTTQAFEDIVFHSGEASEGVKNDHALDAYFQCYKTEKHDDYEAHWKKMIELAGSNFAIGVTYDGQKHRTVQAANEAAGFSNEDETVRQAPVLISARQKIMKCLIFRESGWKNGARNGESDATGLGQQTSVDVAAVNCLIAGCKKEFDDGNGGIKKKFAPPQKWAQSLWNSYFAKARASVSAKEYAFLTTNPKTHQRCTQAMADKVRDANCPLNSIAAMALDQVAIELAVREANPIFKASDEITPAERHEMFLVLGAAHDAGISKAANAAKASGDIFKWAKFLVENKDSGRSAELKKYIKDLSTCIDAGNAGPMGKDPDRSAQCHDAVANAAD